MKTKISNIRDISYEEKKKILGVKYHITLTIFCRESLKRFDLEYVPKYSSNSKHNRTECPGCASIITLPCGEALHKDSNIPFINPLSIMRRGVPHSFENVKKKEIGLYKSKKRG